jgi:acyl-CoA synthetase
MSSAHLAVGVGEVLPELSHPAIADYWDEAVAAVPGQLAVADACGPGFQMTYRQVDDAARRLATVLLSHGMRRGDVLAIQMPNCCEFFICAMAAFKIGVTVTPVLPNYGCSELSYILEKTQAAIYITASEIRDRPYNSLIERACQRETVRCALVNQRGNTPVPAPTNDVPVLDLMEEIAHAQPLAETAICAPDEVAAILFTSGSEAAPKGVLLTHRNLLSSESAFILAGGFRIGEHMLMPASLAHATGFMHGMLTPIMVRGSSIMVDRVRGEECVAMIDKFQVTRGMGTPTIVDRILCAAETLHNPLRTLDCMFCGGAPIPKSLLDAAEGFGVRLISVYGSTESAPHTMSRQNDAPDRHLTTDGRAVPGVEIRVVNPDTHETLPIGIEGEEASRGPNVFVGYLGDRAATRRVLDEEGWYYSGDLCVMDEQGYIRITGRRKDIILRGGENISALEVERIIDAMPGVLGVSVIGVPDSVMGERVCACVIPKGEPLTVEDMRAWFKSRGVARFKTPEYVENLPEFPLTGTGKISKRTLRDQYAGLEKDAVGRSRITAVTQHHE